MHYVLITLMLINGCCFENILMFQQMHTLRYAQCAGVDKHDLEVWVENVGR